MSLTDGCQKRICEIKLANDFYIIPFIVNITLGVGRFQRRWRTVTAHIGRNPKDSWLWPSFLTARAGKHALHIIKWWTFGYVTLIECQLETGRTHQIRVHLKSIRHPLFNDATYGGDRILKGTTFTKYRQFIQNCFKLLPRQALHAKSLGFTHPITGKQLFFDSPLPKDMQAVIDKWRNYSQHKKYEEEDVIDVDLK